jgi:hemolysin III
VVFVIEKPNPWPGVFGFHELWHLLVIIAAALHYLLIYLYVLPA